MESQPYVKTKTINQSINLYKHQQDLLTLAPSSHLLAWGMGTGKTHAMLQLAELYQVDALVVVPKSLKKNWIEVIAKHYNRKSKGYGHRVVTKEELWRDWNKLPPFAAVIVDEAHYFANISQRMRALRSYMKKYDVKYRWFGTATPYLSSPMNIYILANLLGHKIHFPSFKAKFFDMVKMGPKLIPKPKKGMEAELREIILAMGSTVALEDCIDVPPQTYETIYVQTTREQQNALRKVTDVEHIVRFTKKHQIENGTLKGDSLALTEDKIFDNEKTDYIKILAEGNPKLAIFCRYNNQIAYYKTILEQEGYRVFVIDGSNPDRYQTVQDIESSDNCIALIQASCSEGYELPSVPLIVFASLSFSYKDYAQSTGRFLRINKPKKNHYIHLVTKGGVDEAVFECIKAKKDFSTALYSES